MLSLTSTLSTYIFSHLIYLFLRGHSRPYGSYLMSTMVITTTRNSPSTQLLINSIVRVDYNSWYDQDPALCRTYHNFNTTAYLQIYFNFVLPFFL